MAAMTLAVTSKATRVLAPWFPRRARWQTPLRATELAEARHQSIQEWWAGMDRIVALCAWTERVLEINGVPRSQVRKVRHGLTQRTVLPTPAPRRCDDEPVKLVFLGRLDPTKGLHVLLDALDLVPHLRIEVSVHTILESEPGPYTRALQKWLQGHKQVQVRPPIAPSEVVKMLQTASALVVPSVGFETGPLVVLEAFAAGVPVIGSGVGGIAEWVTDGVDGLLVKELTPQAWAAALRRLVAEPGLLAQLTAGVKAPRDMKAVADEMLVIYQELAAEQGKHAIES
jgi:glycosyltransferase involved in cell wall biosynthesis